MKTEPTEYEYRRDERIGILTDGRREPTPEEIEIAEIEADEAVSDL